MLGEDFRRVLIADGRGGEQLASGKVLKCIGELREKIEEAGSTDVVELHGAESVIKIYKMSRSFHQAHGSNECLQSDCSHFLLPFRVEYVEEFLPFITPSICFATQFIPLWRATFVRYFT